MPTVCQFVFPYRQRLSFPQQLIGAALFHTKVFSQYTVNFPVAATGTTAKAYLVVNKAKLKTERPFIYKDCKRETCSGAPADFFIFFILS